MWRIVCAFLLVFLMAESQASPGDYCVDVSDCDSGECCQILSPMQIASRKRGSGGNSTCQRYQKLGQTCDYLDKLNGYCGCEPGTRCTYHYHPPPTPPHTTPTPSTTPGIPSTPSPTTPHVTTPAPGIPVTSPPTPTTRSYRRTLPPTPTSLVYPDTTTSSPEDPPCGRKKRGYVEGVTYDCQPI